MQFGSAEDIEHRIPGLGMEPSDRYYISRTGMPHRSGEVGDFGRHGSHITASQMAELQRSGELEYLIRRIQQARRPPRSWESFEEVREP